MQVDTKESYEKVRDALERQIERAHGIATNALLEHSDFPASVLKFASALETTTEYTSLVNKLTEFEARNTRWSLVS